MSTAPEENDLISKRHRTSNCSASVDLKAEEHLLHQQCDLNKCNFHIKSSAAGAKLVMFTSVCVYCACTLLQTCVYDGRGGQCGTEHG